MVLKGVYWKSMYLAVYSCFYDQLLTELVESINSLYIDVLFLLSGFLWKASWQLGSGWLREKNCQIDLRPYFWPISFSPALQSFYLSFSHNAMSQYMASIIQCILFLKINISYYCGVCAQKERGRGYELLRGEKGEKALLKTCELTT